MKQAGMKTVTLTNSWQKGTKSLNSTRNACRPLSARLCIADNTRTLKSQDLSIIKWQWQLEESCCHCEKILGNMHCFSALKNPLSLVSGTFFCKFIRHLYIKFFLIFVKFLDIYGQLLISRKWKEEEKKDKFYRYVLLFLYFPKNCSNMAHTHNVEDNLCLKHGEE